MTSISQPWRVSWRADPHAKALADRHYNRQTFRPCGQTLGGMLALLLLPEDMPEPLAPRGAQLPLFEEALPR
jgi:hypothetical protein